MASTLTSPNLGTVGTEIDITESGVTFRSPDDSHLTDTERKAAEVLAAAMTKAVLAGAAFAHELLSVAIHRLTDAIPSAAVTRGSYGTGMTEVFLVNPEFMSALVPDDGLFVCCHEAKHLLKGHLYAGTELAQCEHFTLACEVVINDRVLKQLGRKTMPIGPDGKPTGVDPHKVYTKYREAKREKGEVPVSYEQFVSSDLACRSYVMELPKPPKPRQDFCQHPKGDLGDGDGSTMGSDPLDPSASSDTVARILDSLMQRAINGDAAARDELLEIGQEVGEDHPIWGTLGLGALRGETLPSLQVQFWEMFLTQDLATLCEPGCKPEYPRRLAGLSDLYEAEGADLPFMPLGQEPHSLVDIYLDMSGSIGGELVNRMQKLVGSVPGATARWRTFDTEVYEFEPGEELKGGGGTSFQCIMDHVTAQDEDPDVVIILTDGHAQEVYPSFCADLIWLITPGGNAWPRDKGMRCIDVDI